MPFTVTDSVNIPVGTHPATLEKVEEGKHATYGANRKWFWLVEIPADDTGPARMESFSDFTSANTSPSSNAYKRLTALLGRAPKSGEVIEDPTGTRVLLQFVEGDSGFPKIANILPYSPPQQVLDGVPR